MVSKTNKKTNSLARVALGATAVLALAGRTHAAACAGDTYYDGVTKTGAGATFATGSDCTACPTGTTAAATPSGASATFCEGIAANYYGTAGAVAIKHAIATACPTGLLRAASATTVARETCTITIVETSGGATDNLFLDPDNAGDGIVGASVSLTDLYMVASENDGSVTALTSLKFHACPEGTATNYPWSTPMVKNGANPATFCNHIAQNAYGFVSPAASGATGAHATGTICPFAGTTAGIATASTDLRDCTMVCATANDVASADGESCVCAANYYGAPLDAHNAKRGAATHGCTACPTNTGTQTATDQATLSKCLVDAGWYVSAAGTNGGAGTLTQAPTTHYAKGGVSVTAETSVVAAPASGTTYKLGGVFTCPTGFATAAVGKTTRQECKKTFTNPAVSTIDAFSDGTASSAGAVALFACPEGTVGTSFTVAAATGANAATFCHSTIANFYGRQGSFKRHASGVNECPDNSVSSALSTTIADCKCVGGYAAGSLTCKQCPANTYRASGDVVGVEAICLGCGDDKVSVAGASECTAVAVTPDPVPTATTPTTATTSDATRVSVFAMATFIAAAQLVF